jgi:hypothetical protein
MFGVVPSMTQPACSPTQMLAMGGRSSERRAILWLFWADLDHLRIDTEALGRAALLKRPCPGVAAANANMGRRRTSSLAAGFA